MFGPGCTMSSRNSVTDSTSLTNTTATQLDAGCTPAVLPHQAQAANGMLHHVKRRQCSGKGKCKGLLVAFSHKVGEKLIVEAGLQVEVSRQH